MKNARTVLSKHIEVTWDQEEKIVAAMKEYARMVIDRCTEVAELKATGDWDGDEWRYDHELDRESILKVKNELQ